jgi:hypothetical protein
MPAQLFPSKNSLRSPFNSRPVTASDAKGLTVITGTPVTPMLEPMKKMQYISASGVRPSTNRRSCHQVLEYMIIDWVGYQHVAAFRFYFFAHQEQFF